MAQAKKIKLLIVAGARPNFMKVAPLIRAINSQSAGGSVQFEYRLVHTGQHYDTKMSDVFFQELGIPEPDHNLEVGSGSHAVQTAQVMVKFEPVLLHEQPDWVIVVGDVNSTVACALVATKLGIRVAHVEAGLRSYDRTMPEEINRLVTDAIADLLLTPSPDADENLLREGVAKEKIKCVGNIMIDSLVDNLDKARQSAILPTLKLGGADFIYMTLHRPGNVDNRESLTAIINSISELSREARVVFPVHPRTRKMMAEYGLEPWRIAGLSLIEPIGYLDSISLTENARLVLTDSGGLQEEATFFRTPCLTLRPNTERPITITLGSNRLVTTETLLPQAMEAIRGPRRRGRCPDLWDGKTAGRIIGALAGGR